MFSEKTLKKYFNKEFFKSEIVLITAISLALITSFISIPKMEYIDFKVLILLFNLMIVIQGFREVKILDAIALGILKKCSNTRQISGVLVFITFIAAMLVTNDVALITFVPLTLIIGTRGGMDILKVVVFQTLAANLGSSLTPMGNPQNLFLYSFYNINVNEFFRITTPMALVAIVFILVLLLIEKNNVLKVEVPKVKITNKSNAVKFIVLLFIILLSVFQLIDYRIAFIITIVTISLIDKKLFTKVDYSLIITFIGFFIFIGNISNLDIVKNFMESILKSEQNTYLSGILCSQVISNVPATMLLSGFTKFYSQLIIAVNIGGMGTLIASLASVISYKLYVKEYKDLSGKYLKNFTIYNVIGLTLFFIIFL